MILLNRFGVGTKNGFVLFAGGGIGGGGDTNATTRTDKFYFQREVRSVGTVLGIARIVLGATGNYSVGVVSGGISTSSNDQTYTDLYTYASNVVAAGTALTKGRALYTQSAGNATIGLYAGGYSNASATNQTVTDKYTFSTNGVVAGTSLTTAKRSGCGFGTVVQAVFIGGYTTAYTGVSEKYIYASNTTTSGGNLSIATADSGGAGNQTMGIVVGGDAGGSGFTASYRYTHSSDAVASGTALNTGRYCLAGASNESMAVFGGGALNTSYTLTGNTDKYNYTANTMVSATVAGTSVCKYAAASSTPGHF